MHSTIFIQDLTIVLVVAGLVTILFRRLGQPVVLGYILAGFIIGPHSPPFSLIHDQEIIKTLAGLGIILLMFSLGLHFSLRKLKKVGATAFVAAILEILFMFWIGYELGHLFHFKEMDAIFLGAILSISSTTIIVKALHDLGKSNTPFAELIFGILIVEDILAIALLALLSGIALTGELKVGEVADTLIRLGIFLAVVLVMGLLTVPRLLNWVSRFNSREMTLITCLGLCFGVSWLATYLGYSDALGAFLIGAVIAESRQIHDIESLVEPVRDLFSAIFFVSVGLLIDPKLLIQYALPITVITLAVVVGKVATCSFGTYVAGHEPKTSFRVGMGLAQIGEFSFIIAGLGISLGVTSNFLYPIAVMVSVLTTLFTPYLIRGSDRMVDLFERISPKGFVATLELYPRWVHEIRLKEMKEAERKKILSDLWPIGINLALISAIFIVANFIAENGPEYWTARPDYLKDLNILCWFCAMLLSIPFLVVVFRKLKDMGGRLGERAFASHEMPPKRHALVRGLISNTVLMAGVLGVGLWMVILSATMYPQGLGLAFLLILLFMVALTFGRSFHRLYSKAEATLQETVGETRKEL